MQAALWDPALYQRFDRERERPGLDLLAMLRDAAQGRSDIGTVIDLGCGTGALTCRLAEIFPAARIIGLDSSPEMLEYARKLADISRIHWQEGRIEAFAADAASEMPDVIFTNAALHWVADQPFIWPALMRLLRPGGLLAAQIPRPTAPWRAAIGATRALPRWAARLEGAGAAAAIPDPEQLHALLAPFCVMPEIRETIYWHVLPSLDDALDWLKGAALRPVLTTLGAAGEAFLADLRAALDPLLARGPKGEVLFPFPRLFVLAERA